jgi:ATP-dependent Lon protease
MYYEQNKNKIRKSWDGTHKSEMDLEDLKTESFEKIESKKNTYNYVIKRIVTIETEWELMESQTNSPVYKIHKININNFPLKLLPFIRNTLLCKKTNESQVITQLRVNSFYVNVLGLEEYEDIYKVRKNIEIYVGHSIRLYPIDNQYPPVYSKAILTIINPWIFK